MNAEDYIRELKLESHVEGGAFRETYRSIEKAVAPENKGFSSLKNWSTGIYFLLKEGQFSAFHRIKSDEMWHHYDGDGLHIYEINPQGELIVHRLGKDILAGEQFQLTIPAGSWFASRCEVKNGFALVGCTVSPGFDFEDFELASEDQLSKQYPEHKKLISELCRS